MKRSWGQLGSALQRPAAARQAPRAAHFLRSWPQPGLDVFHSALWSYHERFAAFWWAFRLGILLQRPPPAPPPALPVTSSTRGRRQLLRAHICSTHATC